MYEEMEFPAISLMDNARQMALKLNHEYIGTEHILLAFCTHPYSAELVEIGLNPHIVEVEARKLVQPGPQITNPARYLPMTPRAKMVTQLAMEMATPHKTTCGDLLIGLFREQGGVAFQVLANLGVTENSFDAEQMLVTPPPKKTIMERLARLEQIIERLEKLEHIIGGEVK